MKTMLWVFVVRDVRGESIAMGSLSRASWYEDERTAIRRNRPLVLFWGESLGDITGDDLRMGKGSVPPSVNVTLALCGRRNFGFALGLLRLACSSLCDFSIRFCLVLGETLGFDPGGGGGWRRAGRGEVCKTLAKAA